MKASWRGFFQPTVLPPVEYMVAGGRFVQICTGDRLSTSVKILIFYQAIGLLSCLLIFVEQTGPVPRVDRPPNK